MRAQGYWSSWQRLQIVQICCLWHNWDADRFLQLVEVTLIYPFKQCSILISAIHSNCAQSPLLRICCNTALICATCVICNEVLVCSLSTEICKVHFSGQCSLRHKHSFAWATLHQLLNTVAINADSLEQCQKLVSPYHVGINHTTKTSLFISWRIEIEKTFLGLISKLDRMVLFERIEISSHRSVMYALHTFCWNSDKPNYGYSKCMHALRSSSVMEE